MPATKQEIDSFHQFASEQCAGLGIEVSLEELLVLWRQEREYSETVEDVRRGIHDFDAGRGQPLADAFQDVRAQLGLVK